MFMYLNDRDIRFSFAYIQRCYTFSHCWDERTKNAEWARLPDQAEMVWFEYKSCKDDSFLARGGTHGSIDFTGTRLYQKVSSFMVRQSGLYPTDGIVDYCHENATLASTNSSDVEYVDLDDANVGVWTNSSDILYF
jgi:hypothetical protein